MVTGWRKQWALSNIHEKWELGEITEEEYIDALSAMDEYVEGLIRDKEVEEDE